MSTLNGGVMHYDIHDPTDMAYLIKTGLIWKGDQTTVEKAAEYLIQHPDEVNDKVPPQVKAYLEQQQQVQPAPEPETPAEEAAPTEEPIEESPNAPTA